MNQGEVKQLRDEVAKLRKELEDRFREIAELTIQLHKRDTELESLRAQAPKAEAPAKPAVPKRPSLNGIVNLIGANRVVRGNKKSRVATMVKTIRQSNLFDSDWYLRQYPDVAQAGIDPIEHYVKFGALEKRDPAADFNTNNYCLMFPSVDWRQENPLIHYIERSTAGR